MKKTPIIIIITTILIILTTSLLLPQNQKNTPTFPNIQPPPSTFPKDKTTNIVFTTDKKYKEYLKVALKSTITNKNPNTYYNIYILCIDLPQKETNKFKTFEQDKVKINTVALKRRMLNGAIKQKLNFHYVSEADFFKIFLPEMFKEFDKILYLDCDILVLDDLLKLYNTDINDKYLAAVKRFDFSPKLKKDYFNCGVMLINLKKWRQDSIVQKITDVINNNKKDTTLTQYPFNNIVTPDKVRLVSPVYNNIVWPEQDFKIDQYKKNYEPFCNDIKDYKDLSAKTVIAHFAGIQKPWYNPSLEFASIWWQYAHSLNPSWKVEKRNFIKHVFNSLAIVSKFVENNTITDFFRNFYSIFKNS